MSESDGGGHQILRRVLVGGWAAGVVSIIVIIVLIAFGGSMNVRGLFFGPLAIAAVALNVTSLALAIRAIRLLSRRHEFRLPSVVWSAWDLMCLVVAEIAVVWVPGVVKMVL